MRLKKEEIKKLSFLEFLKEVKIYNDIDVNFFFDDSPDEKLFRFVVFYFNVENNVESFSNYKSYLNSANTPESTSDLVTALFKTDKVTENKIIFEVEYSDFFGRILDKSIKIASLLKELNIRIKRMLSILFSYCIGVPVEILDELPLLPKFRFDVLPEVITMDNFNKISEKDWQKLCACAANPLQNKLHKDSIESYYLQKEHLEDGIPIKFSYGDVNNMAFLVIEDGETISVGSSSYASAFPVEIDVPCHETLSNKPKISISDLLAGEEFDIASIFDSLTEGLRSKRTELFFKLVDAGVFLNDNIIYVTDYFKLDSITLNTIIKEYFTSKEVKLKEVLYSYDCSFIAKNIDIANSPTSYIKKDTLYLFPENLGWSPYRLAGNIIPYQNYATLDIGFVAYMFGCMSLLCPQNVVKIVKDVKPTIPLQHIELQKRIKDFYAGKIIDEPDRLSLKNDINAFLNN